MKLVSAIVRPSKLDDVLEALSAIGVKAVTATEVKGFGRQNGYTELYRGAEYEVTPIPKVKIDTAIPDNLLGKAIEAVENALLSEIDRVHFEELMHSHPSLGLAMTRLMIVRRRELENKVEALVFRDVSSKLAELLVKLAGEYGVDDARGTLVALKITHQELANLIGSTRETVSLTLSQFKRRRLIATEGRKVIISDTEALRAMY